MNAKDAIKQTYQFSEMVLTSYISDFTDAELMERPGQGCNHVAYQLGHLISSGCQLLESVAPNASIELPAGFADQHSKENCGSNDASQFRTKAEYVDLMEKLKTATFAAVDNMSDADLDREGPEHLKSFCPTVGSVLLLISTHMMMHAGQLVPIRRKLDKPVMM